MGTWFKRIGWGLLGLVAVVLGLAMTKPDRFAVERKAVVAAQPEAVYALMADFRQFAKWSPWEHLDPQMQRTLSGAAAGEGAVYHWKGNSAVGEGRMEITRASPPREVVIKLDFVEPFASQNTTYYRLTPVAGGTEVSWRMEGPMPFVSKLMSVFVSMDSMIGPDFERGLAQLQKVAAGG